MAASARPRSQGLTLLLFVLVVAEATAAPPPQTSQALRGASTVLRALTQEPAKASPASLDRPAALLARLLEYRQKQASMSSEARAREWVSLAYASSGWDGSERLKAYLSIDPLTGKPIDFSSILASLPPPEDWPALRAACLAHEASSSSTAFRLGLSLFSAALVSDETSLESALRDLKKAGEDGTDERIKGLVRLLAPEIEKTIAARSDDTQRMLAVVMAASRDTESGDDSVEVPDVIGMLGEQAGSAWLSELIVKAERSIAVPVGDETRTVARRIASAHIEELKAAHWGLVSDVEQGALYEAFDRRFPSSGDYSEFYGARRVAQTFYLLSLIGAGRTADARQQLLAMAKSGEFTFSKDMLEDLQAAGHGAEIQNFFETLLEGAPGLKLWKTYFDLSARLGLADEAASFAGRLLQAKKQQATGSADLEVQYAQALLAVDKIEPALAILSASLANASAETRGESGTRLARIGILTDHKDLIETGMHTTRGALDESRGREDMYWRTTALRAYIRLARELGRSAEAEALLSVEMNYAKTYLLQYFEVAGGKSDQYLAQYLRPWAVEVAGVYADAEHWSDVLTWIDGFPYWGDGDIAAILMQEDSAEQPLGLHLARALVALGKTEAANRVLHEALLQASDNDQFYELFLTLNGRAARTEFDRLFAQDKFEERPLIWKAQSLLEDKNIEAAIATVEQAIAIDPSDGEQGPGNRMRAYSIYARALDAQGQADRARSLDDAIAAIRMGEQADRLCDLGLYSRAIRIYEEAATRFDGAYCIQSRLAIQLTNLGRFEEAVPHFRRAYTLMPASFGRVESHCFRCESVFRDVRAQGIANEVFSELRSSGADGARIEYMQGYLRKEQHQYGEALVHFRAAVAADPEYLNAWKAIAEIGERIFLKDWEANTAALRIRELDPNKRHGTMDYGRVTDLASLWKISARNYAQIHKPSGNVYPLQASAAMRKKLEREQQGAQNLATSADHQSVSSTALMAPGLEIAQTPLLKAAVAFINIDGMGEF